MYKLLAIGNWRPGQVRLNRVNASSRPIVPDVERIIEETWTRATSQTGVTLFDGPMCRMESFEVSAEMLRLIVSPTSYKPFVGTNLYHSNLATTYGKNILANPVGVSTLLETADGYLMLGRRNASVAYYPDRVHPFAGTIDPGDGDDPFVAAHRELEEELSLNRADLIDFRCTGLVEDSALLQPELVFAARTSLSREEVDRRVDRTEHHATWAHVASKLDLDGVSHDAAFTPVAVASLFLWEQSRPTNSPAK